MSDLYEELIQNNDNNNAEINKIALEQFFHSGPDQNTLIILDDVNPDIAIQLSKWSGLRNSRLILIRIAKSSNMELGDNPTGQFIHFETHSNEFLAKILITKVKETGLNEKIFGRRAIKTLIKNLPSYVRNMQHILNVARVACDKAIESSSPSVTEKIALQAVRFYSGLKKFQ